MENSDHDGELVPKENYVTGVYIVLIGDKNHAKIQKEIKIDECSLFILVLISCLSNCVVIVVLGRRKR